MANKKKIEPRESTPTSRMDDACYSHDPLDQFLKRKRYVESGRLYADIQYQEAPPNR
jgi:hypothetical protein